MGKQIRFFFRRRIQDKTRQIFTFRSKEEAEAVIKEAWRLTYPNDSTV